MLRKTAINVGNACQNVHKDVLMSQKEPFQSIRRIACIVADAMKSAQRMQY